MTPIEVTAEFPEKAHFLREPHRIKVLYGGRAGTKCLALGTRVMMHDGTTRAVEDVQVGECVMGPDGGPRSVLATASGFGPLFNIKQTYGMDYVVNQDHILSLQKSDSARKDLRIMPSGNPRSPRGRYPHWPITFNMGVAVFATQSKRWRTHFRGYRAGLLRFPAQPVSIDPYFLGLWLGDGTGRELRITTADEEILEYCRAYAEAHGGAISVSGKRGNKAKDVGIQAKRGSYNILWTPFKDYGLNNNKHIPKAYIRNSEEVRLHLLAGIIDTDGHYDGANGGGYVVVQVNERLARNIRHLAATLGFMTTIHQIKTVCSNNGVRGTAWSILINGSNLCAIPCKVKRKQAQQKYIGPRNYLQSTLTVTQSEPGAWAGFTVDGDSLFLLEDGTVTHNSWAAAQQCVLDGLTPMPRGGMLRCLCTRETQHSIEESVHRLLSDTITRLNLSSHYTIQHNKISGNWADVNGKRTEFLFAGIRTSSVDNIKSYESCNRAWAEEAHNISKPSWEIILPTIFRNAGSELWVTFNPRFINDETWQRWVLNPPPDAKVVKIGWEENLWLSSEIRAEIEHLRRTDPIAYANVYGGECISEVVGGIYAEELKKADEEGRICSVPYDRTKPVQTAWDLGFGDPTCIWFVQSGTGYLNFIDYLSANQKTIADYVIALQARGYVYGTDYLPHDAIDNIIHGKLMGKGDQSQTIPNLMRAAGRSVNLSPKLLKTDALNLGRSVFSLCRFDAVKCADGIQGLRHYQWDRNEVDPGRRKPLHDWASHPSEAFQTAAVSIKPGLMAPEVVRSAPRRVVAEI